MNLEDLRAVQDDERRSDSLQSLPDSFYRDVADYVADLREERERAAASAEDPFSSEDVRRLTDEIETAEEVVEAIYERRVGKVVKRASLAAAGMPADDQGLTTEETTLFESLVGEIEANRRTVLDVVGGEAEAATDASGSTPEESTAEAAFDASDAMGGGPETDSSVERSAPADGASGVAEPGAGTAPGEPTAGDEPVEQSAGPDEDAERVTVRITRDVGEIFGVDERTYDLAAEDVVTLPEDNAKPLLDRDAAEPL